MRMKPEQLPGHLAAELAAVYLLSGDEPLQLLEAADAIRGRARESGYVDRQVMNADRSFDWGALAEAAGSLSLFAERRVVDLRLAGKPPEAGARALLAWGESPPPDTLLLVTCPKLDKAVISRAKWVQQLDRIGVVIQVWPVDERMLPQWVQRRMQARGLRPSREAVAMLAERVEGNLLAAAQEIEKLVLLRGAGRIDADAVAAAVADSARFDVFGLVDSALAGKAERTVRMLGGLRAEGVAPPLVVWALTREVRALTEMAAEAAGGTPIEQVFARHKVWERRKPLLRAALKRRTAAGWYGLLRRCGRAERVAKGAAVGNPWDELLQLGLELAGAGGLRAGS